MCLSSKKSIFLAANLLEIISDAPEKILKLIKQTVEILLDTFMDTKGRLEAEKKLISYPMNVEKPNVQVGGKGLKTFTAYVYDFYMS